MNEISGNLFEWWRCKICNTYSQIVAICIEPRLDRVCYYNSHNNNSPSICMIYALGSLPIPGFLARACQVYNRLHKFSINLRASESFLCNAVTVIRPSQRRFISRHLSPITILRNSIPIRIKRSIISRSLSCDQISSIEHLHSIESLKWLKPIIHPETN